jgi:hypothetical protein
MKYFLNKWNILRIFLAVLFSVVTLQTQEINAQQVDYSGTSAANFLKIGIGSRPMAMGDAAIASINSAEALYWNVAALSRVEEEFSFAVSSMEWLVESRNSYVAASYKFDDLGTFGIDLQYLDYGKIEETTVYDQDGTGRFLSASDMVIGLGYARQLTDRFSFGIKIKYINETIADASGDAFAVDLGALFLTSFFDNKLRLAASLSNFGTKIKFEGRDLSITYNIPDNPGNKQIPAELSTIEWDIPLLLRFGISNYFIDNEEVSLLVAYDILDSRDYEIRHNLGTEIGLYKMVYLRGGYKFNYDEVKYTVGIGLDFKNIIDYKLKFDYVFLDFGDFSSLNQFSLLFSL